MIPDSLQNVFDLLYELLGTLVVDSLLLSAFVGILVVIFFIILNQRDLRLDERAYRQDFKPECDLHKHIHRGQTEDDRIDVRKSLEPFRKTTFVTPPDQPQTSVPEPDTPPADAPVLDAPESEDVEQPAHDPPPLTNNVASLPLAYDAPPCTPPQPPGERPAADRPDESPDTSPDHTNRPKAN